MKESYLLVNNILYQQTDGAAMGSPLGSSLANAFLPHYEKNCLDIFPLEYRPLHYQWYTNDIFSKSSNHLKQFQSYLNTHPKKISFNLLRY